MTAAEDNQSVISTTVTKTTSAPNSAYADSNYDRRVVCGCAGVNRFFILILALFFLSFCMSSLICYNATFVAIMDKKTSPLYNGTISPDIDWASSELPIGQRRLSYGVLEKSLTFAGGFVGSMALTFPMNLLLSRFGAHKVMTVVGIISTILCAIAPVVMCWSFPAFVILRVCQGITISNTFPVAGAIVNDWASTHERGTFVAVLSAWTELSALFTMPVSGAVATSVGWDINFYIHAAILGLLTILWALYFRDSPSGHPFVARKEYQKITFGKPPKSGKLVNPVRRIFKSLVIWAVWIAVIGNFLVSQFTISYSPLYLSYTLGFPITTAGVLTIAPMGGLLAVKMFTGLASDKLTCIPEAAKIRIFNTIALLGSGMFFILLTMICPTGNAGDVILIIIPVALLGFSSGGYSKCAVLVSRQYSPFVMSIVQIVACLSLLVGSFVVPAITKDDTFDQWRTVFLIYALVLTFSNTIFIAFASAEPAKWTMQPLSASVALAEEPKETANGVNPNKIIPPPQHKDEIDVEQA